MGDESPTASFDLCVGFSVRLNVKGFCLRQCVLFSPRLSPLTSSHTNFMDIKFNFTQGRSLTACSASSQSELKKPLGQEVKHLKETETSPAAYYTALGIHQHFT